MGNSKQRLKGNSVLEIFVENFPCCRKIREVLVVYGLKHNGVITVQSAAAIKASHAQVPSMEKQASEKVKVQKFPLGGIL